MEKGVRKEGFSMREEPYGRGIASPGLLQGQVKVLRWFWRTGRPGADKYL